MRLFIFVRNCLRYSPTDQTTEEIEMVTLQSSVPSDFRIRLNIPKQRRNDRRLNKLELRVTRMLIIGIFPYCFVTLTLCVNIFVLVFHHSRSFEGFGVEGIIMDVLRELLILHLIYIPIVFTTHSREFRAAGRRFCRHKKSRTATEFDWTECGLSSFPIFITIAKQNSILLLNLIYLIMPSHFHDLKFQFSNIQENRLNCPVMTCSVRLIATWAVCYMHRLIQRCIYILCSKCHKSFYESLGAA